MDVLKEVEALAATKISIIKTVFSLFKLEARLAGLSVFPLLLNLCMLFVVLMTLWLSTMILAGYGVLLASHNFLLSIGLVLLFNLVLFGVLLQYLAFNLKSMSFEKTREYFSKNESVNHEQLEKADKSSNLNDGQDIKSTANQTDGA